MSFLEDNEEWKRLIREAKAKKNTEAQKRAERQKFIDDHFGVTPEEISEIQRRVDEEYEAESEAERQRAEEQSEQERKKEEVMKEQLRLEAIKTAKYNELIDVTKQRILVSEQANQEATEKLNRAYVELLEAQKKLVEEKTRHEGIFGQRKEMVRKLVEKLEVGGSRNE